MTSKTDTATNSNLYSRLDVDLEKEMKGLKLQTLSQNEAENSESSSRSTAPSEGPLTEGAIERPVSSESTSIALPARSAIGESGGSGLDQTADFKNLGPPQEGANASDVRALEVHFEDIESKILKYLARADGVKICAAWFTSTKIEEQLSLMGDVGLIIGSTEKITPGHPEYRANWVHTLLRDLPGMVFVYGGASGKRMMHNKFLVLFREGLAYAVITGSYNYTYSAAENWENIVYIESEALAQKYSTEYAQIQQHCQPLNRYLRS